MYSVYVSRFFTVSVSTFGYLRIEAYLQLPAAFRSLSRPSSAPDAKAFTLCSCSLELLSIAVSFAILVFIGCLPPFSDKIAVSLPLFSFGKTNFFFNCFSLSVSFYSFIQLSMIKLLSRFRIRSIHRSGWTRTIDLALIRRAL